ncbi:MAG: GyrI-like domain-containing protein [Spirochaetaceae bacterium]|nr:MAG: GyrI-like domain-containing protein [Spirochaetaceae bacterium]
MDIRNTKERPTLVIRTSTPVEKLPEVMGSSFGEIMQVMGSAGTQPAGPPFAMYHNMDMSNLDVEMGFPVARKTEGRGRVKAGTLPGGKAAAILHMGPYDRIGEAYEQLTAFVKEKGLEPQSICYEFYLNDPAETAPEELQTEIYFPLKG